MIDILLSTYNGEKYLPEFITSLAEQSDRDFKLLIRDDGSTDRTLSVLKTSLEKNGITGRFIPSSGTHAGVVQSFGQLLAESRSRYVMFADQDDIWHSDKLAEMRRLMIETERASGPDTPLLLHSDLRVCDQSGRLIAESFIRNQKLSPHRNAVSDLLIQNHVTGCTVMINQALKTIIRLPFPPHAICHDWYLAILAAAAGKIVFSDRQFVDYRIHDANVYGLAESSFTVLKNLLKRGSPSLNHRLVLTQTQALDFLQQYGDILSEHDRFLVGQWGNIGHRHKLSRIATCLRCGFHKRTFMKSLGMFCAL